MSTEEIIVTISIEKKTLQVHDSEVLVKEYICATSEKDPSCLEGSLGTPWGWHRVAAKIGDGAAIGTVFEGREPTGEIITDLEQDMEPPYPITTRILWLEGLEEGINKGPGVDSYERYIYIHGSAREHLLGTGCSSGCIHLANKDLVEFYDTISTGTKVYISRD